MEYLYDTEQHTAHLLAAENERLRAENDDLYRQLDNRPLLLPFLVVLAAFACGLFVGLII